MAATTTSRCGRGGEDKVNPLGNKDLPGHGGLVHLSSRAATTTSCRDSGKHPKKPGPVGLHCIGGVIEHLPALTAIGCSTVNSYRRLWDQGFWAPVYADWGYQNRTCGLRISAPGRFEYRAVDSMVNPYLLAAALLMAFDDGLDAQARSGRARRAATSTGDEGRQGRQEAADDAGRGAGRAGADDEVIKRAMPDEMYRVFTHYKGDEWEKFNATVTEWDVAALPRLPALNGGTNAMCGIAGLIHRGKTRRDRQEMTDMLQSLEASRAGFHRLRALRQARRRHELVMRFKVGRAGGDEAGLRHPRPGDGAPRRGRPAHGRARRQGQSRRRTATEYAFRYRFTYGGDRRKLADYIEDVEGAEILSLGHGLELIKDLGDAATVAGQYDLQGFQGTHAIGHTRMATESDVDIRSAHPYWAYPFATSRSCTTASSPTTGRAGARWSGAATASCPTAIPS